MEIFVYRKYLWNVSYAVFTPFQNMAILLIIRNWLELDMPNVLMLDGNSYIGSNLSVSTYLYMFGF